MRVDALLVERGLAPSRAAAQRMVDAGVVFVDGRPVSRSSRAVASDCCIALRETD
ncbi:S4 domain-containing protein [Methyloversatilis sp.]|uniref:S4 domain-containing protein n=1 Tax=Methyloversatilis sp. TaxID=2569862 RepID=UPI0035B1390C